MSHRVLPRSRSGRKADCSDERPDEPGGDNLVTTGRRWTQADIAVDRCFGSTRPFPDIRPADVLQRRTFENGAYAHCLLVTRTASHKYRSNEHSAEDDATAGRAGNHQSHKRRLFFLQMPVILARRISGICINNIANYTTIVNHNLILHNKIVPE
jgi:hypothetical protein